MGENAMWCVLRLCSWEDFEPTIPLPILGGVKAPDGCIGFMPVYESKEAALRDYPNATLVLVERKIKPEVEDGE